MGSPRRYIYIYICVCARKRYIVFMYNNILWICFGPGTGKCGQTMWRPAGRKKIHSLVYTTVNHTHTHSNVRLASLLCAFVKDLSPFRVHVEFGDPFPRRCSAVCIRTPYYTVLQFFFLIFFLLFTSLYTVRYMCDALYSAAMVII